MDETNFSMSLSDFIGTKKISTSIGIDQKRFNFVPFNEGYYEKLYPNMPQSVYKIMSDSAREEQKIIDLRRDTFKKSIDKV